MKAASGTARRTRRAMIAETTARLIGEARRQFAQKGFAQTSAADLCAAAGFTRGALYHHFGGKEGLLEAVLHAIDLEVSQRIDRVAAAQPDPWSAFRACCLGYLDLALEPEIQRIVLRDAPAVLGQRFRELDEAVSIAPMMAAIGELIDAGRMKQGDPEAIARLVNGAILEAALWVAADDEPARRLAKARGALEAMIDGLKAEDVPALSPAAPTPGLPAA